MINALLPELAAALASKRVSSVELTQAFLARIARLNGELNAFITVDEEKSLAEARAADARIAAGERGELLGIPIAHKDIFCAEGWRTTCGSRMLHGWVAPYDAHVIARYKQAGAVILGKTNMDEFAMGSSNENSYFGAARNPWDLAAVPGGSSGGSAVAVAARLSPAATGTDTGGSIRLPASFCGISGIKPSYGIVSRYGMIAFASSLDQGGPMAKSAQELALLLNGMAGFDARDSTSLQRPNENYARALSQSLQGLRIGLPKQYFAAGLDTEVGATIDSALKQLTKLGAKLVEIDLPNTALAIPVYYVLAPAEASSNLSRYDGVRYGFRAEKFDGLTDMYQQTRVKASARK